jgi:nucleotide-binding universal stress UspA family protein
MFKHIIVAIDGSPHSDRCLEYAAALARGFGSSLTLIHAFHHTSDLLGYEEQAKLVARRELAGQAVLDQARRKLGANDLQVQEELLEGPAAEAILALAESGRADLIIMGTRGLGALKGLVLGSVSHKVVHMAHCPVLMIR